MQPNLYFRNLCEHFSEIRFILGPIVNGYAIAQTNLVSFLAHPVCCHVHVNVCCENTVRKSIKSSLEFSVLGVWWTDLILSPVNMLNTTITVVCTVWIYEVKYEFLLRVNVVFCIVCCAVLLHRNFCTFEVVYPVLNFVILHVWVFVTKYLHGGSKKLTPLCFAAHVFCTCLLYTSDAADE